MTSEVFNEDCIQVMKRYPDKFFDLAVVDPPYGIGEDGSRNKTRDNLTKSKNYKPFSGNDLKSPNVNYFKELMRVSKNQIIFGANHFISKIPFDSSCWIVWDKDNGNSHFADSELAWTSFKTSVRNFKFKWNGMWQGDMKNKEIRIHPTQKPIALYDWIYNKYSEKGQIILDTHLGSGSNRISAHKAGLLFVGCEIDKYYFDAQEKRFNDFKRQLNLFE